MKIQVISDVHIGDYPNYETFRFERLNWYLDYADRVISIAKDNDIDHLFIAGDFMDQPVNNPVILKIAKQVLEKFSRYYKSIYFILGQHDILGKNYDLEDLEKYSITNVLSPSNMFYSHKKILNLGGRSIAMMNFNREIDLTWIDEQVDLFIGHVTINTNGFGTEVDYSKFKLGIAGDIHYPCSKKNLYSVGVGVPRYLGDYKDGTCVVVNLDDLSFSTVLIDPDNEYFTRYIKTNDEFQEGPSDEKLLNGISPKTYFIYRPLTEIEDNSKKISYMDCNLKSITSSIDELVSANELSHIHQQVLSRDLEIDPIDLNFQLKSLEILNIRSIDSYKIDFSDKKGVLQLAGNNGSGKSSLIWSLYYALKGGLDINSEIREGESYAYVYLTLNYQGKDFSIYRGTDGVSLEINGVYQSLGNKRQTENAIYEYLPFIYYLDSFFFMDDSVSILDSYSTDRRIELIKTYYRIDILQGYYNKAIELRDEFYKDYLSDLNALNEKDSEINLLQKKLYETEKNLPKESENELQESIDKLQEEYKESVILEDKFKSLDADEVQKSYTIVTSNILSLKKSISGLETSVEGFRKFLKNNVYKDPEYDPDELSQLKDSIKNDLKDLDNKLFEISYSLKNLKEVTCPKCSEKFYISSNAPVDVESLEFSMNDITDKISSKNSELESIELKITESKKILNANEVIKDFENRLNVAESKLDRYKDQLSSHESKKSELEEKLSVINSIKVSESSSSILKEIERNKSLLNKYSNYRNDKEYLESLMSSEDLEGLRIKVKNSESLINDYNQYISLFSDHGPIYKSLLNSLLKTFSSDTFKYEAVEVVYRGKEYLDITGYYKSYQMKSWRNYKQLSRGQRTLVDLDFIKNLVTGSGVIVFDEILKYLSTSNQVEGLRIISSMKSELKLITNQNENSSYVDDCINVTYNGSISVFSK